MEDLRALPDLEFKQLGRRRPSYSSELSEVAKGKRSAFKNVMYCSLQLQYYYKMVVETVEDDTN